MSRTRFENGINPGTLSADPTLPKAGDIYYNNTVNKVKTYNGTSWTNVGSGSGGSKNYLTDVNNNPGNGDFELGVTNGWSLGTIGTLTNGLPTGSPTFGSGASGNLSISTVSSGQLAGLYSLSYASSAATTQGDMLASDAFSIDLEDQAKVLTWKVYYKAQTNPSNVNWSGTSSNSFGVAVWDVTNSAWLPTTASFGMTQSSGVGIVSGVVQTASNASQLRLVVYNVNATSGATTLYFDDFSFGPQTAPIGFAASDWTPFTPVLTSSGGGGVTLNATGKADPNGYWRRIGDSVELFFGFTNGSGGGVTGSAGNLRVGLPSGLVSGTAIQLGPFSGVDGSGIFYSGAGAVATSCSTTNGLTYVTIIKPGTGSAYSLTDFVASSGLSFHAIIPIAGWSSNVQMSNDTDTRVVAVSVNAGDPASTTVNNIIVPVGGAVAFDTHGTFNLGTGRYTVPMSGFYKIHGSARTGSGNVTMYAWKNGVINTELIGWTGAGTNTGASGFTGLMKCNAGDIIDFRPNATLDLNAFYFNIERLSGPSVIAATESVNCRYTNTAGTSITKSANNTVPFATKDFDSHSSFVTDTFTVPLSGKYSVDCYITIAAGATWASGDLIQMNILKNGSDHTSANTVIFFGAFAGSISGHISGTLNCIAGDTIRINLNPVKASAGNLTLNTSAGYNSLAINRVGN